MVELSFFLVLLSYAFCALVIFKYNKANKALQDEITRLNIIRDMMFKRWVDDSESQQVAGILERNIRKNKI